MFKPQSKHSNWSRSSVSPFHTHTYQQLHHEPRCLCSQSAFLCTTDLPRNKVTTVPRAAWNMVTAWRDGASKAEGEVVVGVGGEEKRTTTSDCAYQVHGHQPTWQHRSGTSGAFVQAARLPHPLPPSTAIHVAARSVPRRACRPGRARISRTFTYDKMDWLYTSHGLIDKPSLWEGSEIMGWWACQQGVTSLWLTGVLSQLHSSIGECVGVSVR